MGNSEVLTQAKRWEVRLSASDRERMQHIHCLRDQIEQLLGIDGGIFFLDYFTTQRGEPTTEHVMGYVQQMHPCRTVNADSVAKALQVFSPLPDKTKLLSTLKYALTDRLLHRIPLTVMNYGYTDDHEPDLDNDSLEESERPLRYGLQLYRDLIRGLLLCNRDVAEIGSGNGGGANWITRTQSPRSYVGIDQCFDHVDFCEGQFGNERLSFLYGDAEQLPLGNACADAVLNVESAHCYPSQEQFLKEAHRILRCGGALRVSDLFKPGDVNHFVSMACEVGFHHEGGRNITAQVEKGLLGYLPHLLKLEEKLQSEQQPFYRRLISTRTFNAPDSNWRGKKLEYWNLGFTKL